MIICTGVTKDATRYEIDDSFMAAHGTDNERRIIETQRKVAHSILVAYAEKRKENKPCKGEQLCLEPLAMPSLVMR